MRRRLWPILCLLLACGVAAANPIQAVRWTAVVGTPHEPVDVYLYGPVDSIRYWRDPSWSRRTDNARAGFQLSCVQTFDTTSATCPGGYAASYPDTAEWRTTVKVWGFFAADSVFDPLANRFVVWRYASGLVFGDDGGMGRAIWLGPDSLGAVEGWGFETMAYPDTFGCGSCGDTAKVLVDNGMPRWLTADSTVTVLTPTWAGLPYVIRTLGATTVNGVRALRLEAAADTAQMRAWQP